DSQSQHRIEPQNRRGTLAQRDRRSARTRLAVPRHLRLPHDNSQQPLSCGAINTASNPQNALRITCNPLSIAWLAFYLQTPETADFSLSNAAGECQTKLSEVD